MRGWTHAHTLSLSLLAQPRLGLFFSPARPLCLSLLRSPGIVTNGHFPPRSLPPSLFLPPTCSPSLPSSEPFSEGASEYGKLGHQGGLDDALSQRAIDFSAFSALKPFEDGFFSWVEMRFIGEAASAFWHFYCVSYSEAKVFRGG